MYKIFIKIVNNVGKHQKKNKEIQEMEQNTRTNVLINTTFGISITTTVIVITRHRS